MIITHVYVPIKETMVCFDLDGKMQSCLVIDRVLWYLTSLPYNPRLIHHLLKGTQDGGMAYLLNHPRFHVAGIKLEALMSQAAMHVETLIYIV